VSRADLNSIPCVSRESATESGSPFLGIPGRDPAVPCGSLTPGVTRDGVVTNPIPPLSPEQLEQAARIIEAALERDPDLAERWYAECRRQAPARAATAPPPRRRCPDEGRTA
jgi:hypothetical protein